MTERISTTLYKFRFIVMAIAATASLILLSQLVPASGALGAAPGSSPQTTDTLALGMYDNPNAVSGGFGVAANELGHTIESTNNAMNSGLQTIAFAATESGRIVAQAATFVGNGMGSCVMFTVHGIGSSLVYMVRTTGSIIGFVSGTAVVSAAIRPADDTPAPTIDTHASYLFAAHLTPPPAAAVSRTASPANSEAVWPIHGIITTLYGVPHWPYQPIHTGLDISDGQPAGVTLIRPFKPGRVIQAVRSNIGFGNHVIIDHGGGVTSLYGHLYSISVQVGQEVDSSTTLGYEGSTGASTGTHLHFEVRLNGQAVDPRQYVRGDP